MAVTARNFSAGMALTMYYYVVSPPFGGEHGIYQYIGRDYPFNAKLSILQSMGYPGVD